jgi:hypothetical protein
MIKRYLSEKNVDQEKLGSFFNLFVDNDGIITTGKFADNLTEIAGEIRKLLRTNAKRLHPDLAKVEAKYMSEDRMEWPRSQVKLTKYMEQLNTFARNHLKPKRKGVPTFSAHIERLKDNGIDIPFEPSESFQFSSEGLILSKSGALPKMGSKRDHLQDAANYWDKVEDHRDVDAWMLLAGLKSETAPKGVTKPRVFLLRPVSEWYGEVKYLRDAIKRSVDNCRAGMKRFSLYYMDMDKIHAFVKSRLADCQQAVVLDATQFGANITSQELEDFTRWCVNNKTTNGIEHMVEYSTSSPILYYDGILERLGGLADGSLITNYGDGAIMDWEIWDAFSDMRLDNRINGSLGNGDDKLVFLDTIIDKDMITKLDRATDRDFNPDKTWLSTTSAWFSKIFFCEAYWTSSIALNYNRLKFIRREKMMEGVEFKAYVATRNAMVIENVKRHPVAIEYRDMVREIDKYPIDELDDSIVKPAIEQYRANNSWLIDLGLDAVLDNLQNKSFYAQGAKTG